MLAILATHPIQYQVPIFRSLAERSRVPFEVWFLTSHGVHPAYDVGFGKTFKWDFDLLGGYPSRFPPATHSNKLGSFVSVGLPDDFRCVIKSGTVDAILVHGWNVLACWQAVALARRAGVQVWLRGESNDLKHDSGIRRVLKRRLLSSYLARVDRFLAIGTANARLYRSYGIEPERLRSSPYCVDNQLFASRAAVLRPARGEIRAQWRIPEGAFCLLFAGKFVEKKRPVDVLRALHVLTRTDPDRKYHALFVGAGELDPALRQSADALFGAEPHGTATERSGSTVTCSFAGFLNQSEISKAYVAADALVLPSDSNETWGLVVNEAMASGLPCIVSDACGSSEDLVAPLDPKLRFPMGDTIALAAAIRHLAERPLAPEALSRQVDTHDFGHTVEAIERLWLERALV